MLYSEVLRSMTARDGAWSVAIPDDWKQGRSIFGGLQVALALRAMRTLVPAGIPLRVLQTIFVAPPGADGVSVQASVLRSGKNAVHVEARMQSGEETSCLVTAVFGSARASRVHILPRQHEVRSEAPVVFPFKPGLTPVFSQHFQLRILIGGLPFSGNTLTQAVVEVGLNDSAVTGEEHVLAIADSIPPVALAHLDSPVPGSSLTWTLEMLRDRVDDLPLAGWRLDAELCAGQHGYTNQSVMVWGPGGVPVALSRQCMVIFG